MRVMLQKLNEQALLPGAEGNMKGALSLLLQHTTCAQVCAQGATNRINKSSGNDDVEAQKRHAIAATGPAHRARTNAKTLGQHVPALVPAF